MWILLLFLCCFKGNCVLKTRFFLLYHLSSIYYFSIPQDFSFLFHPILLLGFTFMIPWWSCRPFYSQFVETSRSLEDISVMGQLLQQVLIIFPVFRFKQWFFRLLPVNINNRKKHQNKQQNRKESSHFKLVIFFLKTVKNVAQQNFLLAYSSLGSRIIIL